MSRSTLRSARTVIPASGETGWSTSMPTRRRHSPQARSSAAAELLACGECRLLVGMLVDQPVSPLAGITVLADRSVERDIALKAPVHIDHVLLGDAEASGDELDLVRA